MESSRLPRLRWSVAAVLGLVMCPGPARAGEIAFTRIADTTTLAPGQKLCLCNFGAPAISGTNVVFFGSTTAGAGIYSATLDAPAVTALTDFTMTVPGFLDDSTSFGGSSVSGGCVVLSRVTRKETGIYLNALFQSELLPLVDASTVAPDQSGTFNWFGCPAISGKNFVFTGYSDHNNAKGIYTGVAGELGLHRIVDSNMIPPGQVERFTGFSALVAIAGDHVAYSATYGGAGGPATATGWGIYTGRVGVTGAVRVADLTTLPPGSDTPFTVFPGPPGLSGSHLAFVGYCGEDCSIYLGSAAPGSGLIRIVDLSAPVPGHPSLAFTSFGAPPALSGSNVAFVGGFKGGNGIFLVAGERLINVVSTGDALFGSTVTSIELGPTGYDGNTIAFRYKLADDTQGEAVATLPP